MGEHKLPREPRTPGDHEVKNFMLGRFNIEMFPEGYILLNEELSTGYHPKLEANLANYPVDEIDIRLATIATYCGIVMDGIYTIESRSELCAILAGRLFHLRELTAVHRTENIVGFTADKILVDEITTPNHQPQPTAAQVNLDKVESDLPPPNVDNQGNNHEL